jgi:Mrp family chromosome partitioning ATPase
MNERKLTYEEVTSMIEDTLSMVKHIIIVGSGKGGVGKSMVSANLAWGLSMNGDSVGILDADINGPSLAKMLGIENQSSPMQYFNEKIVPIEKNGLKIISIASFMKSPDEPIVWRGPAKGGVIRQFLSEVEWGELDYLVVDLPPGTGDEALTIGQSIPNADGIIIVTTPQDVALLDSRKAITFAGLLKLPVIGVIENMSGFVCPHCSGSIDIFKKGGGEKAAKELGVDFLGAIPFDQKIVDTCDEGKSYIFTYGKTDNGKIMFDIINKIAEKIEKK